MMYFIPLCSSCTQASFINQNISHQPYEMKIKENYFNTDEFTVIDPFIIDSVINTIDAIDHYKQDYSSVNLRESVSRYLKVVDYHNLKSPKSMKKVSKKYKYPFSKKNNQKYFRKNGYLKQPGGASCNQRR